MKRLFDPESPFWQAVARCADLVIINLLTIAFSLPLITVGAAFTALNDCCWRLYDEQGGSVVRMYWRSFKDNCVPSTVLWFIAAVPLAVLAWVWIYVDASELVVLKALLSICYLTVFPYLWMVQARFENSVGNTVKNAVLMSVARLPYSLGIMLLYVGMGVLIALVTWQLPQALPPLVLLGVALPAYGSIPLFIRSLAPWLMQESDHNSEPSPR
ncbi:YesL family protein [Scrofimicrobium canadense]|nr:YesL family protein [Scrofimicrobium canadense]